MRVRTWDWIYGASPEFNLKQTKRFAGGRIEILMDVKEGRTESIRFMGDYLGLEDVSDIEKRLTGVRFNESDFDAVLGEFDLNKYFGMITKEDILSLIFD